MSVQCSICSSSIDIDVTTRGSAGVLKQALSISASIVVLCDTCKQRLIDTPRIIDELATLKAAISELQQAQLQTDSFFDRFRKEIVETITEAVTKSVDVMVTKSIQAITEKQEKANNLVLVGVPEEKGEDIKDFVVNEVGDFINGLPDSNYVNWSSAVRDVRRFGKPGEKFDDGNPKARIVKVFFYDREARSTFLTNFKNFTNKNPKLKRSFCRTDQTWAERTKDKDAREQLRKRRDLGETNIVVRNGEVVVKGAKAPADKSE